MVYVAVLRGIHVGANNVLGHESSDAILPSESPVSRSLASAIAANAPSRFTPGESNLDWRRWATIPDANAHR